jgi:hypothetical protein
MADSDFIVSLHLVIPFISMAWKEERHTKNIFETSEKKQKDFGRFDTFWLYNKIFN